MNQFTPATPEPITDGIIQEMMEQANLNREDATEALQESRKGEWWINDIYTVIVRRLQVPDPGVPDLIHLSIKRNDREAIHDWRDLQEIKNRFCGPEHEAMEIYPAESRLVDTANQYHLWCIDNPIFRWPWGFRERSVSETSVGASKQRPFQK